MTPANPDALADALAYLKPHETNGGTISLKASKAREAVAVIEAALQRVTAERDEYSEALMKVAEIGGWQASASLYAEVRSRIATAEARAAQLQAEVEALKEDRADAERTLEQWFDTKAKSVEQIGPKLAEALGGYLRVCRCGGMSAEESELVEATLGDFLHRQAGSVIAPVVESMVAARTALAARAATAREGA
jgi:ribosomal protein L17